MIWLVGYIVLGAVSGTFCSWFYLVQDCRKEVHGEPNWKPIHTQRWVPLVFILGAALWPIVAGIVICLIVDFYRSRGQQQAQAKSDDDLLGPSGACVGH